MYIFACYENNSHQLCSPFFFMNLTLCKNKHIHVKGSAERFRDFIYIDDVVRAFLITETVLEQSQYYLFNVCSGVKTTVGELVDSIVKQFDTKISVNFEGSTPGDQFGIYGDPSKMHNILDDWDKVRFEDGMKAFFKEVKEFHL